MTPCLICQNRAADALGSHIIPHFIVASLTNDGAKGRDKEQSFQILNTGSIAYIGRGVQPEVIEQTLGRPLDETDAAQNYYVADNIFCTVCEKKLAVFESLYKRKIDTPLAQGKTLQPSQVRLAYFFWLSIIYRCAVTHFEDFYPHAALVADLSRVVNLLLADSETQTEQNCQEQDIIYNLFIGYFKPSADSSRNVVLLSQSKKSPYLLAINQYTLLFDFELIQVEQFEEELGVHFGVTDNGTSVRIFNEEERNRLLRFFHGVSADIFIALIKRDFVAAYEKQHNHSPSTERVEAFVTDLITSDDLETIKYSAPRLAQLTQKHTALNGV